MGIVKDSPLLRSLFDGDVIARVHCGTPLENALHPDEAKMVATAVDVRRAHFTAGRLSARSALEALGMSTGPLLSDAARAPIWPENVVGSITHTDSFCGAVVAPRTRYHGIGIDAELRARAGEEIWSQILTTTEFPWLLTLPVPSRSEMATVIFCAKEAFYKCQYQVTGAWLGFEGAEVSVGERGFTLRLLDNVGSLVRGQEFSGRFELLPSLVVAGIALAAPEFP